MVMCGVVLSYPINTMCGCGGIGRRIRFRILRHSVCRFKSCHPHQQERAPKGALSCWFGRRGGEAPPLVDFILFARNERRRGRTPVFVCKMMAVPSSRSSSVCGLPQKVGQVLSPAPKSGGAIGSPSFALNRSNALTFPCAHDIIQGMNVFCGGAK